MYLRIVEHIVYSANQELIFAKWKSSTGGVELSERSHLRDTRHPSHTLFPEGSELERTCGVARPWCASCALERSTLLTACRVHIVRPSRECLWRARAYSRTAIHKHVHVNICQEGPRTCTTRSGQRVQIDREAAGADRP